MRPSRPSARAAAAHSPAQPAPERPAAQPAAAGPGPRTRRLLGELLVDAELLSEEQFRDALAQRTIIGDRRERLGETVVRLGLAGQTDIARALAAQLGLDYLSDPAACAESEAVQAVPQALAERHRMLPLRLEPDGTLLVACADPTNFLGLQDVRLASRSRRVAMAVGAAAAIDSAIAAAYGRALGQTAAEFVGEADSGRRDYDEQDELAVSDAPVIRLAEGIIAQAVDLNASDIHVEPDLNDTAVRYRVDGVLKQAMTVPRSVTGPLISRLKLMSGMDIAERRRPQDGRARFRPGKGEEVDLRLSSLPSMHGETMVVRVLRKGADQMKLEDIGFAEQLPHVLRMIDRPQGFVLVTGPTGSGKTSTLYALLAQIASETRNIVTIEDPIESELAGVNQTQVNDRVGLTFARALRTVLRQDPDVVMVGEIRDPETAELALQASLTGHLVLSTLHTNDAPSAVVRLRDLGVPPYLIASSLSMVVGQRLARRPCRDCSQPTKPSQRLLAELGLSRRDIEGGSFRAGAGCQACGHTGYRCRQGLSQVMVVDETIRELIMAQASGSSLREAARVSGMRSLREHGLTMAARGETTLEEVLRVTPTEHSSEAVCMVCAQTVEQDHAFCPWCAASLRANRCGACDHHLQPAWLACPSCGTLAGSKAAEPDASPRARWRPERDDQAPTAALLGRHT